MRKSFFPLLMMLCLNAFSQLSNVSDFKNYSVSPVNTPFIFVSDSLQGGFFTPYSGTYPVDGGMVFSDSLGRKWMRFTETNTVLIRWYGLKPYNNYAAHDDAVVFRTAIKFIKNHSNKYQTLKSDACGFNEWYFLGSTVYLDGINFEGEGQVKNPKTNFQIGTDVSAFRIPANSSPVTIKNIAVRHYYDYANGTDSNNHSFDIHGVFHMENVKIIENPNGDGVHIDAGAGVSEKDTLHFGNADQSSLSHVFADHCINGFWSNGCDANKISFMFCSATGSQRWGMWNNGLLGDDIYNFHLADNGKQFNTGARLRGDTATYFLKVDIGDASIGKRPDLYPEIWYKSSQGMGRLEAWNSTRKYYTAGTVWAMNPNANHKFQGMYTESYQPAAMISARSSWDEGLNGADVIGGMYEHTYSGYKFFSGNGIQSPIVATPVLRLQSISNANAEVDITPETTSSLSFKLPAKSGTLALFDEGYIESVNQGHWIVSSGDFLTDFRKDINDIIFRVPFKCFVSEVRVSTMTSASPGFSVFDVLANGTSILSGKLSIDKNESTSKTAASQAKVKNVIIEDDSEITLKTEQLGENIKNVKFILYYRRL